MGIIDTRSMFNDGFLTNLGYNPSETIRYTLLDPALVLSWLRSNISAEVENNEQESRTNKKLWHLLDFGALYSSGIGLTRATRSI